MEDVSIIIYQFKSDNGLNVLNTFIFHLSCRMASPNTMSEQSSYYFQNIHAIFNCHLSSKSKSKEIVLPKYNNTFQYSGKWNRSCGNLIFPVKQSFTPTTSIQNIYNRQCYLVILYIYICSCSSENVIAGNVHTYIFL